MDMFMSKKVKYFIHCMKFGNFNKAAEELCITRSPLIKTISDIEYSIGEKLFIRNYNVLEPTEIAGMLYGKLMPLYDMSKAIERDLKNELSSSKLQFVFDISFPLGLVKQIISIMKIEGINFTSQRQLVNESCIKELSSSGTKIFLSLRGNISNDHTNRHKITESNLCLLLPTKMNTGELVNGSLPNIPILMYACEFSEDIQKWLTYALREKYSNLHFKTCEMDIMSMVIAVSKGHAMLILPENSALNYHVSGVDKVVIKNVLITSYIYHNAKGEAINSINKVLSIFKTFF